MTTHAEMVEGVRDLVAEMDSEMESLQSRIPASTFMAARAARACLREEQYGEAADHARAVLETLRGVPAGAVGLTSFEWAALQGCAIDAATSLRLEPVVRMTMKERHDRRKLLEALDRIADLLNSAEGVYIAPRAKDDA